MKQQLLSCTVLVPVNLTTPHLGTISALCQTQHYVNRLRTCLSWWNLSVEPLTYMWVESRKTWMIWWCRRTGNWEGERNRERQEGDAGQFLWSWLIYHMTTAAIWGADGQTVVHWAAADGPHNYNTWWELHNKETGKIESMFLLLRTQNRESTCDWGGCDWTSRKFLSLSHLLCHSLFWNQINSPNITATAIDIDTSTGTTEYQKQWVGHKKV